MCTGNDGLARGLHPAFLEADVAATAADAEVAVEEPAEALSSGMSWGEKLPFFFFFFFFPPFCFLVLWFASTTVAVLRLT